MRRFSSSIRTGGKLLGRPEAALVDFHFPASYFMELGEKVAVFKTRYSELVLTVVTLIFVISTFFLRPSFLRGYLKFIIGVLALLIVLYGLLRRYSNKKTD